MTEPLAVIGESVPLGPVSDRLTLVAGSAFCVAAASGDLVADRPHGLFFRDTRFLSAYQLRIDGDPPEVLATIPEDLHAATIVARHRAPVGRGPSLVVFRRRMLTPGLRETVTLRNPRSVAAECRVELEVSTDFAALFDVKEGRAPPGLHAASRLRGRTLEFRGVGDAAGAVTTLDFSEPIDLVGRRVCVDLVVPPKGERSITVDISAQADDGSSLTVHDEAPDRDDHAALDHLRWRSPLPTVHSDDERLAGACRRAVDDLAALRIVDDRYGPSPVLAAGVPWFMTLFGRDSLIASWMALPLDPSLALTTLRVLGQLQGQEVDDRTEEQPGRILHEVRFGRSSLVGPGGGPIYYGSADATPLYVALAGELARWGAPPDELEALLPHVDRALEWIQGWGDADGDGYVEYQCRNPGGLVNQGWKDSWDSIGFADGRLAEPPIALCEVQGYVHAAYRSRADLADLFGDPGAARSWRERAEDLVRRFDRDFWIEETGWYALGLDGDKQPIDARTSNAGHLLWSGIASPSRSPAVAAGLIDDDLFTGWGVRTLARSMVRYDPLSYHNGSVWPHDTALAAAGLKRYGHRAEATTLLDGLLAAAGHFGRHLPELFTGLGREDAAVPVEYPSSSVPQAWAAAAPLLALRAILGLEPDLVHGRVELDPTLLPGMSTVRLEGVPLGADVAATIAVDGDALTVDGLPDGVQLVG